MQDLMVDLETLGTRPGCAVVSIGAVFFDIEFDNLGATFYRAIALEKSVGLRVEAETLVWWMQRDAAARRVFSDDDRVSLDRALQDFEDFVRRNTTGEVRLWGNGAAFDNAILAEVYEAAGRMEFIPWKFRNDRCYRTLKSLAPEIPLVRVGTYHNALDDAVSQARHAVAILRHLFPREPEDDLK